MSTRQKLLEIINPFHKRWWYAAPHVTVAGFIVGFILLVSALTAVQYGVDYFSHKYQASIQVPTAHALAPDHPVVGAASTGVIPQLWRYPGVGDQDGQGSCAAFASTWDLSYAFRLFHNDNIRFSPRYAYDYYSNTYNAGRDGGSWPDQDLEYAAQGIPTWRQFPEGAAPFIIDHPTPTFPGQFLHHAAHTFHTITGYAQGAGQGAVDGAKSSINAGHAVLLGFPVWPEYDNAALTNGLIVSPTAAELAAQPQGRGGHENVAIAYDDNKIMPDGTVGAVEIQNQWTLRWGVSGRAWMSYDFLRRFSFGMEYLTMGVSTSQGSGSGGGNHPITFANPLKIQPAIVNGKLAVHPTHLPPVLPPGVTPRSSAWYVHNVVTRDTGVNISGALNYWGTRFGVWPVGLAAVAGTESSVHQYADRCCTPGDTSYGLMQFTTGTACSYGVCSDIRNRLDNLNTSIYLAAKMFHDIQVQVDVPWIWEYVAYNAGSGYGYHAFFYTHPTGTAYQNLYGNFVPNYNYALSFYASYSNPTPKPKPFSFPYNAYEKYRDNHHLSRISPFLKKGGLNWAASVWTHHQKLGGIKRPEQWFGKGSGRSYGFTKTSYRFGAIYAWPHYRTTRVVKTVDCRYHLDSCL